MAHVTVNASVVSCAGVAEQLGSQVLGSCYEGHIVLLVETSSCTKQVQLNTAGLAQPIHTCGMTCLHLWLQLW
jgi:hypothetical protein